MRARVYFNIMHICFVCLSLPAPSGFALHASSSFAVLAYAPMTLGCFYAVVLLLSLLW